MRDYKTRAMVLRRTNYGEADRILNILTPGGKKVVMAKGVRREKSKMAGGIEMFSISEVTIHEGRGEMGVLTGVRLIEFFSGIMEDYERIEVATDIIKRVARAAEQVDSVEFYEILEEVLRGISGGMGLALVRLWAGMRLSRAVGEEVNLWMDVSGEKLRAEARYEWDGGEGAMREMAKGSITGGEIKFLRLMMSGGLGVVSRVVGAEEMSDKLVGSGIGG